MVTNQTANFPHKVLLTNTQITSLRKAFENNLLINIKLLKTHLSRMIKAGGFLGIVLGPLMKAG